MKVTPFSLPGSYLVLELANGCNLRCTHCAQSDESHPHYRTTGYFPRLEVQKLLADLARHHVRFDALILFWLGEPLLHPEFADIYRDLLDHCLEHDTFGQIELHTNASMLTRKVAARALNRVPVPQRWHLTIDAATPETYLAIKGSDLLPRVEENVERIAGFRGRGGFPFPQLVLQYIVSERNELEVDPFIAKWKAVFDRHRLPLESTAFHVPHDFQRNYLFLKALDCPTAEEQARQNRVYRRVVERLELAPPFNPDEVGKVEAGAEVIARDLDVPCSGFWKSPVIGWDGMLTTCTRDSLGENALGTVFETPFSELWFGEGRIAAWRRKVGGGDYSSMALCQSCFIPKSVNYTGITAEEIERVAGVGGAARPDAAAARPDAAAGRHDAAAARPDAGAARPDVAAARHDAAAARPDAAAARHDAGAGRHDAAAARPDAGAARHDAAAARHDAAAARHDVAAARPDVAEDRADADGNQRRRLAASGGGP